IKAGALLGDTRTLLTQWNEDLTVSANLERFRHENLLGKASRSRVEDILTIFRQRYLTDPAVTNALVTISKSSFTPEILERILYFFAAQSDMLLHDIVTEVLWDIYVQGRSDVSLESLRGIVSQWVEEGKTAGRWNTETTLRVAQGLMATLRDFRILEGKVKK